MQILIYENFLIMEHKNVCTKQVGTASSHSTKKKGKSFIKNFVSNWYKDSWAMLR